MTKYLNKFENNDAESNISILTNIDILTTIFSMIIGKIKNCNKNNILENENKESQENKENKENNENKDNKDNKENKENNENNENNKEDDYYEYYLNYILTINDSFKNKLKAIKLYNNFKNLFLTVLFKNIERLILNLSEIVGDENINEQFSQQYPFPYSKEYPKQNDMNSYNYMPKFNNNNPTPLNMDFLNNNLFQKNNFFQPPLFNVTNNNNNFSSPQNFSEMFQNNGINKNIPMFNIPELDFNLNGNIPNFFNNNQYNLNPQQSNLNMNPIFLTNPEQKNFSDKINKN